MTTRPIYYNVDGAPVRIGQRVIIAGPGDETFDAQFIGLHGTVEYLEYDCGCGQTYPMDPMIGVLLDSGQHEEFWKEELSKPSHAKATHWAQLGDFARVPKPPPSSHRIPLP